MNVIDRRLFILGGILCCSNTVLGQRLEVSKSGKKQIDISLDGLKVDGSSQSVEFLDVLRADLINSGIFRESSSANILIKGNIKKREGLSAEIQAVQVYEKNVILNRLFSGESNVVRALAHRVSDSLVFLMTGQPGMASARLAIVGNKSGHKELYICDYDGFNLIQVTNDKSIVVAPAWMPNGKNILYTSYKNGYPNVFLSGQKKAISKFGGLNTGGVVSPDGKKLALILSKDGNPELYIQDIASGFIQRISSTRRANEASPCWSPDSSELAYVSDTSGRPHVYVLNLKTGVSRRISRYGSENVAPDWSFNGKLAYCSRQTGRYRIVVVDIKTGDSKLLPMNNADYEDPSWMPDGRHLVVSCTVNYRSSIYLLDTHEDRSISLKLGSGDWFSPDCSI